MKKCGNNTLYYKSYFEEITCDTNFRGTLKKMAIS